MRKLNKQITQSLISSTLIMALSFSVMTPLYAQQQDTTETDGSAIEDFIEQSEDEEFSDDTYLEDLDLTIVNKLNLNFATREELQELGLLSDIQIRNIIYYRERFGELKSAYELLGIEELTIVEIQRLLPYLKFKETKDPPKPLKEMFQQGKHQIFLRYQQIIEKKKGYTPPDTNSDGSLTTRYLGQEPRLYGRYRFQYGTDLSIGLTAEQDPGEPFKHPKQKIGIDYLSGHFFLKNRGALKRIAIGDFEVNLGQGLFLQQGYGSRKSSQVNKVKKKRLPFKAHTSANEAEYSRGAAVQIGIGKQWDVVLFGSYRKIDGNVVIEQDSTFSEDDPFNTFSSIQTSGLHRTESELEDKNVIGLASTGGSLSWTGQKARLTGNAAYFNLSDPLIRAPQLYNKFDFNGDQLINASLDYQYLNKNMSLFGEIAFSDNGGWGMINGGDFHLPGGTKLTVVHRYYAKNFQTLFAEGFGESSRPVNENGLYIGLTFSPFKYAEWANYVDFYQHPWLRFGIDAPSKGIDLMSHFKYRPKRSITLEVRGRYERKQENAPANETAIDYLVNTTKSNFRIGLTYKPTWQLTLKSRIEFAWYNDGVNETSKGIMAFQDINYKFKKIPLTLYGRYAIYQTDTYDSRIYAYENDLLYVFSVPAYYGRGSRYYLMASIRASRNFSFWVRWSQTIWTDRDVVSSGLEEIQNNTKSEIKVQLRIKF